ncbi:MAG: shikimate dehydrogenase [Candidatus Fluviicola riflensis]|nr:MAG: shikimate dehydrogenase [Candidatus Fluviicola riflensis]OGS78881.1 MAG: shikimate dehydrogenase [Candidatus Fluviicola riflensis]OGS85903.1 MAG: shikimate dehydrogenase [Fluviicola sp. RIFCSPHIGHO2_12_FULL_43_24]OGS86312.1 MAG: shikimate dehydrogenase [Fluviicola sp. RIFCSPHIGHO2_01_FULL_43_53]
MRKFGLIGKQLGHSFSKVFFTEKFQQESISAVYENIEIPEIAEVRPVLASGSFAGLNVTIPYKEDVIPYLDELSDEAKAIGAVNVIAFRNGKTIGYNTDAFGFHQSIKPFLTNKHERALILGTGGASKAVAYVFESIGLDVIYASRNPAGPKQFGYSDINQHMLNACKVIVNCTPVGTFPNVNESVPFPFEYLTEEHLVIDLIYNPAQTHFLAQSAEAGATILNGLSMLKEQANKAWEIWNL